MSRGERVPNVTILSAQCKPLVAERGARWRKRLSIHCASLCAWQAAGSLLPCGRADHARFGSLCISSLGRAAGPVFVLESLCNSGWPVTHVNCLNFPNPVTTDTGQHFWLHRIPNCEGKNAALMNMQAPSVNEFKCHREGTCQVHSTTYTRAWFRMLSRGTQFLWDT